MKTLQTLLATLFFTAMALGQPPTGNAENAYFTHLQQIYFENNSGQYNSYLIPSLKKYFLRFPKSAQQEQITFMLAQTFKRAHRDFAAFYYFSRLLFVYPAGALRVQAGQSVDSLLFKSRNLAFHERSDSLQTVFKSMKPGSETQENLFAFFSFIYMLNVDSLHKYLLEDIDRYRTRFGLQAAYSDLLLFWQARIYSHQHNSHAACAALQELLALFPDSDIRPKALLLCAELNEHNLHHYEQARIYLVKIINNFPGSDESAKAQLLLGELYEQELHNPSLAIENYRLFIQNYAHHRLRCRAFMHLAPLLSATKAFSESVQTYMQYYQECADSAGALNALRQILQLAEKKLHDRQRSAETLLLLAVKSPSDSLSAAYLYRAASLFAELPQQKYRARQTCRLLIKQFAGTKEARQAKKLLISLGKN